MAMRALTAAQLDRLRRVRRLNNRGDFPIYLMETPDGQQVAVKSMGTALFSFRARTLFVQRLRALLHIHHPHIVTIYGGKVRRANQCVVAMHYLSRGSLLDVVQPGERRIWSLPLPPLEAQRLILEIADGLATLHGRDIMHGGLKLSNVLLAPDNEGQLHAQLSDMLLHHGINGYQPRDLAQRPIGVADPFLYVAPEQYRQRPSLASDRYALGVIAFVLLTGESPHTVDPVAFLQSQIHPQIRRASELNPILPPAVDGVLEQMLGYMPRERYRTVREFAQDLRSALGFHPRPSISIKLEAIPQGGKTTKAPAEPKDSRSHEKLSVPVPLAVIGDAPRTPGMPPLPPNYHWSPEVIASLPALPDAPPEPEVHYTRPHRGSAALIALIVVVATLIGIISAIFIAHLFVH